MSRVLESPREILQRRAIGNAVWHLCHQLGHRDHDYLTALLSAALDPTLTRDHWPDGAPFTVTPFGLHPMDNVVEYIRWCEHVSS